MHTRKSLTKGRDAPVMQRVSSQSFPACGQRTATQSSARLCYLREQDSSLRRSVWAGFPWHCHMDVQGARLRMYLLLGKQLLPLVQLAP